ncbi:MAG: RidA family protein [Caulobacteraceae bacterium]|nr:RidA family protein [Caulobacteraceae bacterium]
MTDKILPDSGQLGGRNPYVELARLGLSLPAPRPPVANFQPAVVDGQLVYLSGQGPVGPEGVVFKGKLGADVSIEDGYAAARLTTLNLLAALEGAAGSLSRVRKIIKVLGMVNATPDFMAHPLVLNGCSDLLVEVFGPEVGTHARSAVGMGSLPGQIAVEIEMIVGLHADGGC